MSKTVLITGVCGGIGTGIARRFKEANWSLIGIDISGDGNKYCDLFIPADISDPLSVRKVSDAVRKQYGSIQCLINNAAVQFEKTLAETSEEEWKRIFSVNVDAVYYMIKHCMDMLENGSIINISSVHARATSKGLAAYAATKGALSALTRAMALELAEHGMRVNAILPGAIETLMLSKSLMRNLDTDAARKRLVHATPLKKIGSPEDIANLAFFLADSALSGNITGQEFVCDGGALARLSTE